MLSETLVLQRGLRASEEVYLEAVGDGRRRRERGRILAEEGHLGGPRRVQRQEHRREVRELAEAFRPDDGRIGLQRVGG